MSQRSVDSPSTLPDWVFPWPAFDMDFGRCALIVIDYQNYSVNPACGLTRLVIERHPDIARYYVPRIREVTIPNTARLMRAFREAGREVVFTRNGGLLPGGRDLIPRRRQRDAEAWDSTGGPTLWSVGTFEHEIIEELTPLPGELVIDKNSSSPFNSTGLDQVLRNLGIDSLFLAGMATDMCVENAARDASDRGFNVVVLEDAVVTFVPEHHYAALSALARVYAQVWSTADALIWLASASWETNQS